MGRLTRANNLTRGGNETKTRFPVAFVEDTSYCERHGKTYRHAYPNATQRPSDRREKYRIMRAKGYAPEMARQFRDHRRGWTQLDKVAGGNDPK